MPSLFARSVRTASLALSTSTHDRRSAPETGSSLLQSRPTSVSRKSTRWSVMHDRTLGFNICTS